MFYFSSARMYAQYLWERHLQENCSVLEALDHHLAELDLGESIVSDDTFPYQTADTRILAVRFDVESINEPTSVIYLRDDRKGEVFETKFGRNDTTVKYPDAKVPELEKFVPEWMRKGLEKEKSLRGSPAYHHLIPGGRTLPYPIQQTIPIVKKSSLSEEDR